MTEPHVYYARMHQRLDTAENWAAADPTLAPGEFGIQYDPDSPGNIALKLGRDLPWSETPFIQISEALPTDLGYDPGTRLLTSSTGEDVTLPLVGTVLSGAPVAGLQTAEEAARLAATGSPTFAGLSVTGTAYLDHIHGALAGPVYQHVRNASGVSMAALTPYRIAAPGMQGDTDRATIFPARADDPALMPAVGILSGVLAPNADGHGEVAGVISGVDTSGMTSGAPVYVGAGGGLVTTPPSANVQVVAVVGRVHASTGSLVVQIGTVRPTAAEVGADPAGTATAAVGAHAGGTGVHSISAVAGLQAALDSKAPATLTVVAVTYAATVNIDFAAYNGTIVMISTLSGNLQFTFSNIAVGRFCSVDIVCDGTSRNLTFPAAAPFLGTKPSSIAASKVARLALECTGTTEASLRCGWAVQQ
jgi:hypothetical protein